MKFYSEAPPLARATFFVHYGGAAASTWANI
jgi:hypothetical protein